jgi:hypothetical protein
LRDKLSQSCLTFVVCLLYTSVNPVKLTFHSIDSVSLGDKLPCHAEGFGQCLGLLIDSFLQSSIEALQTQVTRREIFFFWPLDMKPSLATLKWSGGFYLLSYLWILGQVCFLRGVEKKKTVSEWGDISRPESQKVDLVWSFFQTEGFSVDILLERFFWQWLPHVQVSAGGVFGTARRSFFHRFSIIDCADTVHLLQGDIFHSRIQQ